MHEEVANEINAFGIIAVIASILVALFLLDQLLLWIERKGYLYYRKVKRKGTSASNVLLPFQNIFEPEIEHLIDMRYEDTQDEHRASDDKDKNDQDRDEDSLEDIAEK